MGMFYLWTGYSGSIWSDLIFRVKIKCWRLCCFVTSPFRRYLLYPALLGFPGRVAPVIESNSLKESAISFLALYHVAVSTE
jgi:hypothetical protein